MKLPQSQEEREQRYLDIVKACFASRADRRAQYSILRNWYIFGSGEVNAPVEYNRLFSHIDLYSSFLFSGEATAFNIQIPETAGIDIEFETLKAQQLVGPLQAVWSDSNVDVMFNEALLWALVFNTCFLKLVPRGTSNIDPYIVMPYDFGVLREDVPTLMQQEAIAHEYQMTRSQLERRIEMLPIEKQKEILSHLKHQEPQEQPEGALPSAVEKLVINATQPDIKGQVNTAQLLAYDFAARVQEDSVMCQELWVYDDDLQDWRTVTIVENVTVLYDAGKNIFVNGNLPFIKITPNMMGNYFWGRSELMFLTPLQEWINVRVPQIKKILAKLADPPTSGFGVLETKLAALMNAGGIAAFSDVPAQMAKVEQHYPKEVNDLFRELNLISEMFNEISGIKDVMRGGGETGVRSGGHADLLARLGSSRVKKKAFVLEDSVNMCAHLLLQILKRNDPTRYSVEYMEKSIPFIAKQLTPAARVRVDSHSSSPMFIESQMDKAVLLYDKGAIDEEDLIDAVRYHNADFIKKKLRKRKEAAAIAAAKEAAEAAKGGQDGKIPKGGESGA